MAVSKSYAYIEQRPDNQRVRFGGKAVYRHRVCAQLVGFEKQLTPVLQAMAPDLVVEIGTFRGGFTLFLSDCFPNAEIITYDVIDRAKFLDNVSNVERRIENIFDTDYNLTSERFVQEVQMHDRVLVMCDGGNKKQEVITLSKVLNAGDYIMWHDYAEEPLRSQHRDTNKWQWFELQKSDIESTLYEHGFEFVHPELQNVVWGCARKVT